MRFRPSFVAVAFALSACSSVGQEVRAKGPVTTDPARLVEEAAKKDGPSRSDVHAHVVSRSDKDAIVEVSWDERAPNDVESLDDAMMHVVRRFAVRGDEIAAIAPKPWEVTGTLVACIDVGDCVVVPRSAHVEPTGESIQVPVEGPIPVGLAYRVRLPGDAKAYWTVPAHTCLNDVELDDGTRGSAIGTCSAIGAEEPTLFRD